MWRRFPFGLLKYSLQKKAPPMPIYRHHLQNRRLRVQVLVPLPKPPNGFRSVVFLFPEEFPTFPLSEVSFFTICISVISCFPIFFPYPAEYVSLMDSQNFCILAALSCFARKSAPHYQKTAAKAWCFCRCKLMGYYWSSTSSSSKVNSRVSPQLGQTMLPDSRTSSSKSMTLPQAHSTS